MEFRTRRYKKNKYRGIVYNYNHINVTHINATHILYQPELRGKFFLKNKINKFQILNRVIWGKFVKNNVFKNLLNYIGSEIVDDCINDVEDTIIAEGLFHIA